MKVRCKQNSKVNLDEVVVKSGNKPDSDIYHFYTDATDLLNSLLDKSIWSNKNEQRGQFDMQAAVDYNTGKIKDDAYVCFTTYPGKNGISKGYHRPFGLSFAENTFDKNNQSTKIFSQVAFKTCKNIKEANIINSIKDEYVKKYGEKYGSKFIDGLSEQSFIVQAIGIVPVQPNERDLYKNSDDPENKYFISGGDTPKPWTAKYFPITKRNTTLYNIIKEQFKNLLTSEEQKHQIYWFNSDHHIGRAKGKFNVISKIKISTDKTKEVKIDISDREYDGNYNNKEISGVGKIFNINPEFNLNPNFCPRPDLIFHKREIINADGSKSIKDDIVGFSATIAFPDNFTDFTEIIGIGRIYFGNPNMANFTYVNDQSRGGYSGVKVMGLSVASLLPFLDSMEKNEYDIDRVQLTEDDFKDLKEHNFGDKNIFLGVDQFKSFVSAFNEHEKRVYIPNKKNLKFNLSDIKSIIMPSQFEIVPDKTCYFENLISYIQQYNTSATTAWLNAIKSNPHLTKNQRELIKLPDKLLPPSELSDGALYALACQPKDGFDKCIKWQIAKEQGSDVALPKILENALNCKSLLPPYGLKLIRDICKLIEDQSAPLGRVAIEFIYLEKSPKVSSDKLSKAYKSAMAEILEAEEDVLVPKSKDDNKNFHGISQKFFEPETNKYGSKSYARYLVDAKKFFNFEDAFLDDKDKVYDDEISVLVPIKPEITGEAGKKATTGQNARVGTEALVVGFDKQGKAYLLMAPKPHLSFGFFELPGGGITKKESLFSEASRVAELKDKLKYKTGVDPNDIKYLENTYPYQLLYSETAISNNKEMLAKISWSFYFLSGGIYQKFIDPEDLEYRNTNDKYTAYLTWFPIETIEYKEVFLTRYAKCLPYIKKLASKGKEYGPKETEAGADELTDESELDNKMAESLITKFFNNFW